jgi:uncharacterized protein YjiS (DUF1127 family)
MPVLSILSTLASWIHRLQCEWRHMRSVRRETREIASMSQRELADIGLSHAAMLDAMRRSGCI